MRKILNKITKITLIKVNRKDMHRKIKTNLIIKITIATNKSKIITIIMKFLILTKIKILLIQKDLKNLKNFQINLASDSLMEKNFIMSLLEAGSMNLTIIMIKTEFLALLLQNSYHMIQKLQMNY